MIITWDSNEQLQSITVHVISQADFLFFVFTRQNLFCQLIEGIIDTVLSSRQYLVAVIIADGITDGNSKFRHFLIIVFRVLFKRTGRVEGGLSFQCITGGNSGIPVRIFPECTPQIHGDAISGSRVTEDGCFCNGYIITVLTDAGRQEKYTSCWDCQQKEDAYESQDSTHGSSSFPDSSESSSYLLRSIENIIPRISITRTDVMTRPNPPLSSNNSAVSTIMTL